MDQARPQGTVLGEAASAALMEALGQGACLVGADGAVLWSNEAFDRLDERTRGEVVVACRLMAGDASKAGSRRPGGAAPPQVRQFDATAPDGSKVYEVLVSPVSPAATGGKPAAAAVVREVTAARVTQRKLDAIDRAGAALVGLEADAVRKMGAVDRLKALESRIVALCKDLLHFDHFAIRLIDRRTGRLEPVMSEGLPPESQELEIYPLAEGNGITGFVAATGKSYICRDVETDALFLPGIVGARSSLTVPLRLGERVIGTFDVESQQPAAFGEEDRQFAEIFARYVAMAFHLLDLLVVERSTTNEAVSGRVAGEIAEPLDDILEETDWFKDLSTREPEAATHIDKIRSDVASIRKRLREVTSGPQTLLGVEKALQERKREPLLEGKRILVADDEPNVRRIIHDILHNRGCKVWTFDDGSGAIEALEEVRLGKRPPFDAVLSDIKMPDKNGYEVYSSARTCQPGLPVILMTGFGYDPHHSIVRASQDGLQAVLFKPFPVERLLDEVRKAVAPKMPS
jgi:two-component system, sensor histidine kinase SagS